MDTFLTEPVAEPHNMKKVRDLHGQLQDTVSNLSTKITVLLREREKDFLAAYRHHMYNVQKDLQEAKRSVKKAKDDLRNNDQIKKLKKERDWFRNEALRLEKLSKTQEKEIDSIQLKFNTLREDRVWFEKQLKIAKRQIKILTAELGMQLHRGAEHVSQHARLGGGNQPQYGSGGELAESPSGGGSDSEPVGSPSARPGSTPVGGSGGGGGAMGPRSSAMDRSGGLSSLGRFGGSADEGGDGETVADLRHTIEELRDKLRDAKRKNRNLTAVVQHSNKAGQYEEVFMACVDEVKKEAARRREKLLLSQRKSRRDAGELELHAIQVTAHQELDELTAADKKKILDTLLAHPDIFEHLHAAIFFRAQQGHDDHLRSPARSGLPRIE
jgi:hypothetical protein